MNISNNSNNKNSLFSNNNNKKNSSILPLSNNKKNNSQLSGMFGMNSSNSSSNNTASSSSIQNASRSFLQSNSFISRSIFVVIVVVAFILLLRFGLYLIDYFTNPSRSPILIDGMINGQKEYVVEVDPNMQGSIPIFRSDNENQGIEFTYNCWVFIDNIYYKKDTYQHIFHKGDDQFKNKNCDKPGISYPNNCPGLYITPNTNSFSLFMNTYDEVLEEIIIENMPINKWINLTFRLQNKSVDVYVNGLLTKRHELSGPPRQNYGKVWCCKNGGFGGYLSTLHYFDYAISYTKIQEILVKGPKMNMIGSSTDIKPPYLSMKWYFDEMRAMK